MAYRFKNNKKKQKSWILSYYECNFHISNACLKEGISRATYYSWYLNDEEFRNELQELEKLDYTILKNNFYEGIYSDDLSVRVKYYATLPERIKLKMFNENDSENKDINLNDIQIG